MAAVVSRYMVDLTQQVVGVAQQVEALAIEPWLLAVGLAVGLGTSVVAAWIPARSASRVDPVQALQKGKYQVLSAGENRRRRRMALLACAISIACLFVSDSELVFYTGYVFMIVTGLLLAPALTLLLSKA